MERADGREEMMPPLNPGLLRALLSLIFCAGVLIVLQGFLGGADGRNAPGEVPAPEQDVSVWQMLEETYAENGAVRGTTYENRSLGFRITFPEGWLVSATTSSDNLLEARSGSVVAYVAAATYIPWQPLSGSGEFAPEALNSFTTGLLEAYESTEWPVYTFTYTPLQLEIGDSTVFQALLGVTNAAGDVYANDYYLFSNGPTYYALRFHYYNDVPTYENMSGVPEQILQAVEFFEAE